MVNPIPECARKLWDEWNIRGVILLSLSLQAILFLFASLRKRTANKLIIFLIWSVYLLADLSAIFALGLISNSVGAQTTPADHDSSKPAEINSELLAFWTPFLFLHLGGPDNITAFALEDNELWFRHFVGLLIQALAALYIFLLSLPKNKLVIPTILMFIAGSGKYLERTRAFYLARFDRFQDSTFNELADPGPNYANFMKEYTSKKKDKQPPSPGKTTTVEGRLELYVRLNVLQVLHYAYKYFNIFKGIFVDLILEAHQHRESRDFFLRLSPDDAIRVIEVELNLIYEAFYTKVQVVSSLAGCICRFIYLGLVVVALTMFHFRVKKNHGIDGFDVAITHALFWVAIALDTMALFILVCYDFTLGALMDPDNGSKFVSKMKFSRAAMLRWVLDLKTPRRHACDNHSGKVIATPFLFGRWSGYVSGYNLIGYCLKRRPTRAYKVRNYLHRCIDKVIDQFIRLLAIAINKVRLLLNNVIFIRRLGRIIDCFGFMIGKVIDLLGLSNFLNEIIYVSHEPLTTELWAFIFDELRSKSRCADDPEIAKEISSSRGAWTLREMDHPRLMHFKIDALMRYVTQVTFDESILLWHIATELLYQNEDELPGNTNHMDHHRDHRECSKLLSDYMLHLLIMNPTMISNVAGFAKLRFHETCAELRSVRSTSLKTNHEKEVFNEIRGMVDPKRQEKGDGSKSVLFDATVLAKELEDLGEREEDKWVLISKVWVEMLSYAAYYSTSRTHAQHVSKGGELLTIVWFLMAHFGLREQLHNYNWDGDCNVDIP